MAAKANNKGRPADTLRVLKMLVESDGMSNRALRTELGLTDTRYGEIRTELINEGAIEKYRCQGGGVRITAVGEKSLSKSDDGPKSHVKDEKDLYSPLVDYLDNQSEEDEVFAVAIDTATLRSKGKWQNPDVTQVAYEQYGVVTTLLQPAAVGTRIARSEAAPACSIPVVRRG